MAKVEVAYSDRLKALQGDSGLFQSLKDFVHDLKNFKNNKRARLRLSQEPTAEFYMSSAYFSPEQAQVLLSFKGRDGVTLEQALQSRITRKLQTSEGEVSSARYELCTSHVLAPIFQEHFSLVMVAALLVMTPLSGPPAHIRFHENLWPVNSRVKGGMCGLGLGLKSWPQISSFVAKPPFPRFNDYQFLLGKNPSGRQWNRSRRGRPLVVCEAGRNDSSEEGASDRLRTWILKNARRRQEPLGERIMRMVAGASSAPIAQYIPSPVTPLHTLDPRVKQAWLLALVVLPARSHMAIRIGIVVFLALATIGTLPRRIWQDQLGRMAVLSGLLFVMLALGTDGVPPVMQARRPLPLAEGLPKLPAALGGYKYVLLKLGPVQLTRKGVSIAAAASCLSFTVLQSASLCLTTTTPEQLAAALRWYLTPLASIGAPVEELILTLLLSLRFIGIVFDEVRNLAVGVVARNIEWKSLRLSETADTFFNLFGRIFKNLFSHADQISQAMVARGYRGNPVKHHIYFLTKLSIQPRDWAAMAGLLMLVVLSMYTEHMLPA